MTDRKLPTIYVKLNESGELERLFSDKPDSVIASLWAWPYGKQTTYVPAPTKCAECRHWVPNWTRNTGNHCSQGLCDQPQDGSGFCSQAERKV